MVFRIEDKSGSSHASASARSPRAVGAGSFRHHRDVAKSLPLIACSLGADDQRARLEEWRFLIASSTARMELDGGVRYLFGAAEGLLEKVQALAAAESQCCAFLRFEIEQRNDGVALSVTTDAAGQDALRFIFS
jgi:hypothetical protein